MKFNQRLEGSQEGFQAVEGSSSGGRMFYEIDELKFIEYQLETGETGSKGEQNYTQVILGFLQVIDMIIE